MNPGHEIVTTITTLKGRIDALFGQWTFLHDHSQFFTAILLLVGGLVVMCGVAAYVMGGVFFERKIAGHIQDRVGPWRVGWHGILQLPADGLKLMLKEDLCPAAADKLLFSLSIFVVLCSCCATFAVMPFSWAFTLADLDVGLLYLVSVGSGVLIGVVMAGWGSNNKWSLLGAMRSVAVVVSYEIPIGLCLILVVMLVGSLSMQKIVLAQAPYLVLSDLRHPVPAPGANWGFLDWFAFRYPPFMMVAALILFIAALAEANRTPFDLQEAESEIVAGFHTEFSGLRWSYFMFAEYADMLILSMLSTTVFWGGWIPLQITNPQTPDAWVFWFGAALFGLYMLYLWSYYLRKGEFLLIGIQILSIVAYGLCLWLIPSITWFVTKALVHVLVMMWMRWTLPRPRIDQLMYICWKVLVPFSFVNFLAVGVWHVYFR
jgi:NADH-quinone oxidoreductase subunit H